ncbi:MAG: FG-GAP repeat protein, partial [Anaerolineae bacterium]|nr:FG-GAP repeat protein [Anaerolineae bacterium]
MNGTIAKNSVPAAIVHALVALAIILAPLPRASAAGSTAATGPSSTGSADLSGVPEGLAAGEWEVIQGLIRQAEYQLTWHEPSNAYTAPNRANGLRLAFGAGGVQVRPSDPAETWTWNLALTGYGTAGTVRPASGAPVPVVDANRVAYRWDGTLAEWYVNDERGLEQGFTIAAPPAGAPASQVVLEMALHTDLVPALAADGQSVTFRRPSQAGWQSGTEVLRYDSLRVSDAVGRQLPAHMHLSGCGQAATCRLELVIDATSASYPLTVDPLLHSQVAKLTAADAEDNDCFGTSVAISGDTVVVGAFGKDDASGAAYVYTRNRYGADNWGQVKKLTASDAADGDWFGDSVAISGDTVVVGAGSADGERGAAYVYARNSGGGDSWGQVKKLTASDAEDGDWFGDSVAISGDTAVVGAPYEGAAGSARGAAYVYARNSG